MKKIVYVAVIAGLAFSIKSNAQCTVNKLAVQLKSIVTSGNECQATFDLSWNQEVNHGNKYACIHLWRSDQYPDLKANGLAYTHSSDQPTLSDLTTALATIVIEQNGTSTPVIGSIYEPDPSVPVLYAGLTIKKEAVTSAIERMTLSNISLTIPACTGSSITGDIWASQADHGQNVHCVSSNVSVVVGNPRVYGLLYCQLPRLYNVQITNVSAADIEVSYNIYIDEGDGAYEPTSHDLKITSTPVGPITISSGTTYNSGIQGYLPYSNNKPYADRGLWVEATTSGIPNVTIFFMPNSCIPLPVTIDVFSAQRKQSIVQLDWETANEANNKGFELQRKNGNGQFNPIAFVPSRAIAGNSQTRMSYSYQDLNTFTGITEYRIKQVDINGQEKYSTIRAVRGEGQENGITVYPNPAVNGTIQVILDDRKAAYQITLLDAAGRSLMKWNKVTAQNFVIGNIRPGYYSLIVINTETLERTTKKILVLQ